MQAETMARRSFLKQSMALAAGVSVLNLSGSAKGNAGSAGLQKALQFGMLPRELSAADKFALARKCGFDGIEIGRMEDLNEAKRLCEPAKAAGTPIHSICYGGWHAPLSDPDPGVRERGLDGMKTALKCANAIGATTVLLVPAVVTESVSYADAYKRSQECIRKLLPTAEEMQVVIAVENVWNKFLLSPLEFARYVDEFESPWLRAYFDIGNVILFGFSQDWIRTLGKRIVRIHLKDFKRNGYQWVNLLDGDVNWPQVRRALDDIGYKGFLTTELPGGDENYLTDLSGRIDRFFKM